MTDRIHSYEVRPRKDKRGVDLISDALPFGRLWYDGPNADSNAIGYASQYSRAHPWALLSASGYLAATVRLHPEPTDAVVGRATAAMRRLRPRLLAARRLLGQSLDVPALSGAVNVAAPAAVQLVKRSRADAARRLRLHDDVRVGSTGRD